MSRDQVFMFAVLGQAIAMDQATRQAISVMKPGFMAGVQVAQVVVEAADFYRTLPPNADLAQAARDFVTKRYQELTIPKL